MNHPKQKHHYNRNKPNTKNKLQGRFYLAASIRGPKGNQATLDTMQENILAGIARAEYLRDCFPDSIFYCPHEHEHLFQQAFKKQYVTSKAILAQCFSILQLCDAVFVCTDPAESEGVRAEIEKAEQNGVPVVPLWRHLEHEWPGVIGRLRLKR